MPRRLILAPRALADLDDARAWLTQPGSGPFAWGELDAILAAVEDTGRDETAGDVRVLRAYAPGQNRRGFRPP